jgi:hypothetical protein
MSKKLLFKILIAVTIFALALTSCNLIGYFNQDETEDFAQIETIAAATIAARLTQSVFETAIAQLTQIAPTATGYVPLATNTPQPTNTPIATFTIAAPIATAVPPTKTPVPIPCNAASFVADVTIPDWSSIYAGESFVKTWKVKNVGTCAWTKEYKIYFYSGTQMKAPDSVAFPGTVNPGESVNLSVNMVAPSDTGSYTGSWLFKSANGTVFGVGSGYNAAVTVNIKVVQVPASKDPNTIYDMAKAYCDAAWRTNAGDITCPSLKVDTVNGSITRSYAPVLSSGAKDDEGAIYTVPAKGGDGMIQGKFPKIKIENGYHFKAFIDCAYKAEKCDVTYEVQYIEIGGAETSGSLGTWDLKYGSSINLDVDLSALSGKTIRLVLKVISKGDSTDDVALWLAPRITKP